MSVTYGFYNSNNGDRIYDAEDVSGMFNGLMSDGVIDNYLDNMAVTAGSGMTVSVGAGRCWFDSTWTYVSEPYILEIEEAEVAIQRRDAVVVRVDTTERTNEILVVKGSVSTPNSVSIEDTDHVLAYVTVPANATSVTVTDNRGTDDCPWVSFTGVDTERLRNDADNLIKDLKREIENVESGAFYMPKTGGEFTGVAQATETVRTINYGVGELMNISIRDSNDDAVTSTKLIFYRK